MEVRSHTFSLANLKQLIFESDRFCEPHEREINSLNEDNISRDCVICSNGVFGSHNVVVPHSPMGIVFKLTSLHFMHGSCYRELKATQQRLDSRKICPHCQDPLARELQFSSVAHAVVSGQIDHALQLMQEQEQAHDLQHSWHGSKMTALHIAAINGEKNMARLLQVEGIDIDVLDSEGNTALHHAVRNHNLETVKTLLKFNADANIRNNCGGFTPLHLAARKPKYPDLFTLLIEHKARFDIPDERGRLAIHAASEGGHELALEHLIKNKADVNAIAQDGRTALHYATVFDYFDCDPRPKNRLTLARMLINAGAKVDLRSGCGYTAFDGVDRVSDSSDRDELIKLLLSSAVNDFSDVNIPANSSGYSLLEYALEVEDKEAMQKLLDRGAQVTNHDTLYTLLDDCEDKQAFLRMLNAACCRA
ncbi:ankyrin repeat domain-containing protein [Endozoicomonas sp. SCSIO W0465]|uniref:ankyrin repeat domain-containing protein n=1 Tax=Endozoicomonas sp. SCSIO W0465 TaxID=2918516 RepID=UPI00207611BA|nr:ankyrin repeat domain-containing protein [Endozoicomonas sp. SCSIO W0465]USE33833.1 ankyrin repeat domain-containing protein [Endozoicomonas sp. SCSIO W0465]